MPLIISQKIRDKLLNKHGVTETEIVECFENRVGNYLSDPRELHLTNPITEWFVAETDAGRKLKVMFVRLNADIHIKSAYDPSDAVKRLYSRLGM